MLPETIDLYLLSIVSYLTFIAKFEEIMRYLLQKGLIKIHQYLEKAFVVARYGGARCMFAIKKTTKQIKNNALVVKRFGPTVRK